MIINNQSVDYMPRPTNFAVRERLLEEGAELVRSRGFHACSVQDISDAAKIPKGSFYSYFESKELFAIEILQSYWRGVEELNETQATTALKCSPLRQHFRSIADYHSKNGYLHGCLLGNFALELGGSNENVRQCIQELFDTWKERLKKLLVLEKQNYSPEMLDRIASLLIAAFEGAVMQAKVMRSNRSFQDFEEIILSKFLS